MTRMTTAVLFGALAFLVSSFPAVAQSTPTSPTYDVKTMNFDLWCQEQANLPPDRCDKRLPLDEEQFEAYRAKIEKYELPYLQDKQHQNDLQTGIMSRDPVDNPTDKKPAANGSTPGN